MTDERTATVHLVWIDGDVVVLDLAADRYSCFIADRHDGVTRGLAAIADGLAGAGLDPSIPAQAQQRPLSGRWRDDPPMLAAAIGIADIRDFVVSLLAAAWRFRRWPVSRLVVPGRPAQSTRSAAHGIADVVARFDTLATLVPFGPACLFRCLWLRAFLERRGFATDWVFGVQLFPFRAHCWLAQGDCVIGDASHRVGGFSPIFMAAARC